MNALNFPKSIHLEPVQKEHLKILSDLRQNHSAWKKMSSEQLSQAYENKWSSENMTSHWLITVNNRVYGEIGWKSYTPGEYVYLDLIIFRKEVYSLDLATNLITPFVRILLKHFRIHTVRCSVLRPDKGLETFLGSMNFRSLSVRKIPPRSFFPGGIMSSYEVECDHLIHKYSKVDKITWKSMQLIPFKLMDIDAAPVDFSEIILSAPGEKKCVTMKNRQDLLRYFESLSPDFDIRTVISRQNEHVYKIGALILNPEYPEGLILRDLYGIHNTRRRKTGWTSLHVFSILFAGIL